MSKERRSLKNLLIFPAGQVRLIFVFPVLGLSSVIFLLWALWNVLFSRLENLRGSAPPSIAEAISELERVTSHIFILGMGFTATAILMVATFGLLISHRYYGPLVPILRSVRAMTAGNYGERIHPRHGDELKELSAALNQLTEALAAKHGEAAGPAPRS